jgi:hypothetical protein
MTARRQVVGIQPIERAACLRPVETVAPQSNPRWILEIVLEHDLVEVFEQLLAKYHAVGRCVIDPARGHGCTEAERVALHFYVNVGSRYRVAQAIHHVHGKICLAMLLDSLIGSGKPLLRAN